MAQPLNLRPGISPPHSCYHCDKFIIYLYDEVGTARTDKPTWYTSNPSQVQLAEKLFGLTYAQSEDPTKVWEFYQRTDGISFFDTNLIELDAYAQDECVLSQHILMCLTKDDFRPEVFAIGASIKMAYSLELGILDLDNLSWELLLGDENDSCPDNTYSILSFSDDPATQIIDNRPINTEPGSVIALMQAKQWLHICSTQHETCKHPSINFTPTRLIQLTYGSPKIICRLVETQPGELKPYAALSYCWGGDQVFKTKLATLPIYKNLIRLEDLPQGLQDAIFVVDQLGFKYI